MVRRRNFRHARRHARTRCRRHECRKCFERSIARHDASKRLASSLIPILYCQSYRFDARHANTLLNPIVIIEVLSPSTADYDRTAKLDNFKQIASVQDILLIEPERVRVEHFHCLNDGQWLHHVETTLENSITLNSINCTLPLSEIYQTIELPDETLLRTME